MKQRVLVEELTDLIGEDALCGLAETFGGTRLYIPAKINTNLELVGSIGEEAAKRLARRLSGATIRVPLMREEWVARYRAAGMSNPRIAVRLGITETGVDKVVERLKAAGKLC